MKYLLAILLGLNVAALFLAQPASAATCGDFSTQGEAQRYYDQYGGRLDRDQDGIACEDLPTGGYSTPQRRYSQSPVTSNTCQYRLKPETNVRSGPSTSSGIIATMRPSPRQDPITVYSSQTGQDGQSWSWITFNFGGDETPGWVRSDLIVCQ